MSVAASLLLALALPANAAEFVLPHIDFGALRQAAVPGLREGAPQEAPQPAQALVVLKLVNRAVAAETDWTDLPEGMRRALIEVRPAEGAALAPGEVSLEVAEVRNGGDYAPGTGSLKASARDGSEWTPPSATTPSSTRWG